MKVVINNSTKYNSSDIAKVVRATVSHYKDRSDFQFLKSLRGLHVRVSYTHGSRNHCGESGGHAYYNSNQLAIHLPAQTSPNIEDLAGTIRHELLHCAGYKHGEMNEQDRFVSGDYSFAKSLAVREKQVAAAKPRLTGRSYYESAETKAIRKADEWRKSLKHSEAMLAKWEKKQKYYQAKKDKVAI